MMKLRQNLTRKMKENKMSITEFTKKLLNMNTNFFTVYCIFKSPICNVDLRRGYFKDYFEATFFANILDEIYNSQDFPYIILR